MKPVLMECIDKQNSAPDRKITNTRSITNIETEGMILRHPAAITDPS